VLFDLDDTLCDYSGARSGRLRGAFDLALDLAGIRNVDLDLLIAESIAIHPHGSDHFQALLARHGVDNPEHALAARSWYHANRFLGLGLFAGTRDVLATVRSTPGVLRIGIVTNGPTEIQRAKLELLDLSSLIDFAVISGEVGVEKPDARIFAEALRLGNRSPGDAIYVGDSPEFDVDGARNAGIDCVWVNPAGVPWPRSTPAPERQIANISEFLTLLQM
jgi:HAD superfamily hydrolase (TIGR01549 family)